MQSIHIATNGIISLLMAEEYSIVYIHHMFFIYSSVNGGLGCFHVLAIINSAAVNNGVQGSFWTMLFFGYVPKNGIAGSHGSYVSSF